MKDVAMNFKIFKHGVPDRQFSYINATKFYC